MPENPEPWREARGRKSDQGDYRPTTGRGLRHACFSAIMTMYLHQNARRQTQFASARMLAALHRVPSPLHGSTAFARPPQPLRKRL